MKALFATLAVALLSVTAQAANLKPGGYPMQVLKIDQFRNLMPVIVDPGMPLPYRKVHTTFTVKVESCTTYRAEQFEVKTKYSNDVQLVLIEPVAPLLDCMGPTHSYELMINTSDLMPYKPIVVLNAIPAEYTEAH